MGEQYELKQLSPNFIVTMKDSQNNIKSLSDQFFRLKNNAAKLSLLHEQSTVAKEKLEVKLKNRDAKIEFLENEIRRLAILKDNRDKMIEAISGQLKEACSALNGLNEKLLAKEERGIAFFNAKKKLKTISGEIVRLSGVLEKNTLGEVSYSQVPEKIKLKQVQYVPALNNNSLESQYALDFLSIEGGAKEMKIEVPQSEWDALQQSVLRKYGEGFMQYCFGGKIRLLERNQMIREINKTSLFLGKLKEQVGNKKCVIIGNGPSLNHHDFSLMEGNFMIGSNYIFMNREKMGYFPDLITASNFLVVEQRLKEFLEVPVPKIFPFYMYNLVGSHDNVFYVNLNHLPEFSENIGLWASTRSTVTFFNLQLAYYLGFAETFLIGVDNTYTQSTKAEGKVLNQEEDDPNHFSPEYFKGLKWQSADPNNMAMVYSVAKKFFDNAGRKISNAGIGGALEVFPRVDYKKALQSEGVKPKLNGAPKVNRVIVSINPDLQSYFGHYYQLDLKVADLVSKRGDGFVVLANKSVDLGLNSKFPFMLPLFSEQSYVLGIRKIEEGDVEQLFISELLEGIVLVKKIFPDVQSYEFFMYCGAYPHLRAISKVMENENQKESGMGVCRFHVHVFYPAFESAFDRSSKKQAEEFFNRENLDENLRLYAGTKEFRSHIKGAHGVDLRYLPCSSTTFTDEELPSYRESGKKASDIICFPGNLRPEKGMEVTIDALFNICNDSEFKNLKMIVRRFKKTEELDEVDFFKCGLGRRISWVEGELSDQQFKEMMAIADIVVIPYSKGAFEMRPSGLFADSIMLEKPVLVEEGTFMANFVQLYGNGAVYGSGDGADLVTKLKDILRNMETLELACKLARASWEEGNSWNAFYEKLIN